jgi:thiol-disulfide isomerase/thioredoxin
MCKRLLFVLIALFVLNSLQAQTVGEKAVLNHVDLFDGMRFNPKTTEGKPTLVYFWASWCPICRQELPILEKRFQTYKDKGFNIIAINFRDKPDKARAMIDSIKPISFPVGTINDNWRSDYPKINATPTWILLDKKGIVRKVVVGQEVITGGWRDGLEDELKKVLAESGS